MALIRPFLNVAANGHGVLHRRSFLRQLSAGAGAGALSLGWRDMLIARADELQKNQRSMILLWMDGGPSQFESFNPKVGSPNQGPMGAIPTKLPGVHFAELWPRMAEVADKIALIRSMVSNEADHFRAIKLVRTGYRLNPTLPYPTWGSVVARDRFDASFDLPAFVRIGKPRIKTRDVNSGLLGAKYESFKVDTPGKVPDNVMPTVDPATLQRRLALTEQLDQQFAADGGSLAVSEKKAVYEQTSQFVLSPKVNVFDLDQEPEKLRDEYGRTDFGQGCLLARRLVEKGVSFVEVFGHGSKNDAGWDTHGNGFRDTPNLCGETDPAYSTLLRDLEDRGLLENTLVVWMGEFGRTPKIKKDGGRDHYAKGWQASLSGAGIKTGQVIGATDKDGVDATDRPVGVSDLFVTFCHCLGMDPHHEYVTREDQPIQLVKGGELISELF
ncbi:DUF1501 domain-containing protein [Lignipirellula cremea]|uniref:DUF1501 domain-containing protein n=1 Tax=Lignipirellula cremea TaxID=2528010 RepID=A0A518DZQ0_9BACT|nr:DUF1501 domain-containing protein [Lignipirellula cremea]QDU97314.1 hypothetical protein Pla8534_51600 [Lignipirellula cremea]